MDSHSKVSSVVFIASIFGMLSVAVAEAQPVVHSGTFTLQNPAIFDVQVDDGNGLQESFLPGSLDGTYTDAGGTDTASAQLNVLLPSVLGNGQFETSLQASNSESTSTGEIGSAPGGGASAELSFYFEVAGPTNDSLQLAVSSMGGGSSTNAGGQYLAKFSMTPTEGGLQVLDLTAGQNIAGDPSAPASWSINQDYTVSANTLYAVDLTVEASGATGPGVSGFENNAYIDPTFAVDPANPDANEYTIEYSSNLNSVPEPSSWRLLLGGLGILAFCFHRREKKKAKKGQAAFLVVSAPSDRRSWTAATREIGLRARSRPVWAEGR